MNIAFVGCGFVFDIYMRTAKAHPELKITGLYDIDHERLETVGNYYSYHTYSSFDELLDDESIEIIVNLTNIGAHYEVSKKAILAGKHVYSEKPLTKNLKQSRELFELAKTNGVIFSGAPSNVYSDSVRTILKAVKEGAIGKPLLIYAELDDNPIHLMEFEKVRSPSGAPWPLTEEILEGCTYEHVGYHLVWICALLGPAKSVTAFSNELIDSKTASLPGKVGTPDFSVACLEFENGASARITCSFVAPRDHRMRVIGDKGEVSSDGYRQYRSPVYLEQYSKRSLSARKFRTIRRSPLISRLFGVEGQKLKLLRNWKSSAVEKDQLTSSSIKNRVIEWLRRKEVYAQDKMIGIAELALEIQNSREPFLSPDFLLHLNELTLCIQNAGPKGITIEPKTSFEPLGDIPNMIK